MKAVYGLLMAFLATISLNAQNQKNVEFPTDSLMKEILPLLNENKWTFWIDLNGTNSQSKTKVLEITFKSDSLCFITEKGTKKVSMFQHIDLTEGRGFWGDPNSKIIRLGSVVAIWKHEVNFTPGSKKSIAYIGEANKQMLKLYDLLLPFEKEYNARDLKEFQKVVDDYNKMTVKPVMTEEQRKYIVQANALMEEKKYYEAIEAYDKAMKINPVTYPPAYYNMALLSAEWPGVKYAISYMKKYLMLVPNAEDARAAQDKIYEWELKITQ